ncbi:MAG: S41 family peptidase [Rubrivivax sp.]|jgi:carboxyl-terminal processing protease|nr:S41 family peptidase [Rubrivivax sp.]
MECKPMVKAETHSDTGAEHRGRGTGAAWRRWATAGAALMLLSACGGGGGDGGSVGGGAAGCSTVEVKRYLSNYFNTDYFWYRLSPAPSPEGASSVAQHFDALLSKGDATFPADRWSGFESTESFNRFFGDGKTLGYGVSVAGLEVAGFPARPLYVRSVDPLSPAAGAGLVRGDQVLALNGRSAADLIAANDLGALSATAAGQTLTIQWRTAAGAERSATLSSVIYDLSPVRGSRVVITPGGRRLGYLEVRNMVSQTATPLDATFASFRASGVQDIVLDLRYNGGGLVSMAGTIASYIAGNAAAGRTFTTLLYNDKRQAQNQSFLFANPTPAAAANVPRVYVLMGRRTCSASEQIVNGLQGVGVQVVTIGETTCGKPVGFVPTSDSCGTTYSVVNFESVNALNQGRYFNGLAASCAVTESFTQDQGGLGDPLMSAASTMADGGRCPVGLSARQEKPSEQRFWQGGAEPGDRQGMLGR